MSSQQLIMVCHKRLTFSFGLLMFDWFWWVSFWPIPPWSGPGSHFSDPLTWPRPNTLGQVTDQTCQALTKSYPGSRLVCSSNRPSLYATFESTSFATPELQAQMKRLTLDSSSLACLQHLIAVLFVRTKGDNNPPIHFIIVWSDLV